VPQPDSATTAHRMSILLIMTDLPFGLRWP